MTVEKFLITENWQRLLKSHSWLMIIVWSSMCIAALPYPTRQIKLISNKTFAQGRMNFILLKNWKQRLWKNWKVVANQRPGISYSVEPLFRYNIIAKTREYNHWLLSSIVGFTWKKNSQLIREGGKCWLRNWDKLERCYRKINFVMCRIRTEILIVFGRQKIEPSVWNDKLASSKQIKAIYLGV